MSARRNLLITCAFAIAGARICSAQSNHVRSVDARPMLDLGGNDADTMSDFTAIAGATRLRDGSVVVADQMGYAVRVFDSHGKFVRTIGRKGEGPGEFSQSLLRMYRCGDSLFVMQWNQTTSVFSGAGKFARIVRFVASKRGEQFYSAACNRDRVWAGYGWDHTHPTGRGSFRAPVPFWTNNPDGTVHASLGNHPGSERYATMLDGVVHGSGPLPFGKQTAIAIGGSRVYIGTADSSSVLIYSLDGTSQGSMQVGGAPAPLTTADIAHFIERDTAGKQPESQKSRISSLKQSVEWPKTMPAYRALMVDSEDDLWVQAYPAVGQPAATWNIFSATGQRVATVQLPNDFEINEIGKDYLLGHMPDGPDKVTHVKVFHLSRNGDH